MGRHRAHQLAATNVPAALQAARGCPDAWYRVQALASVAEHADPKLALSILEEAAREALACHDAYGTVAVMSWPLSVAMARGFRDFVERELPRCLALAGQVTPAASQAYALETLWTACFAVDAHWAKPVWTRILALCHPDRSWRAARLYLHVAERQQGKSPDGAARVVRAMPQGKTRSWLERRFGLA
ncbi:hypothetical protein [Bradyrhizobium yuanmingense]|uniref:hypothetical protein n=1 Tax=Bradyrhizobium yuanmingense TaxID=108015 RepID=UPI0023B9F737|nr:hypothetical protein [Bradyrhizobium yuanmingense]MDF0583690.1 hypothetical protein [Bradyrhizobium yuanmingense]